MLEDNQKIISTGLSNSIFLKKLKTLNQIVSNSIKWWLSILTEQVNQEEISREPNSRELKESDSTDNSILKSGILIIKSIDFFHLIDSPEDSPN